MRKVNYQEFKEIVKKKAVFTVRMINRDAPRRRPRDPQEIEVLAQLAWLSWDRAIAAGRLEKRGSRRFRMNINA